MFLYICINDSCVYSVCVCVCVCVCGCHTYIPAQVFCRWCVCVCIYIPLQWYRDIYIYITQIYNTHTCVRGYSYNSHSIHISCTRICMYVRGYSYNYVRGYWYNSHSIHISREIFITHILFIFLEKFL
jgi:hypothetical protein